MPGLGRERRLVVAPELDRVDADHGLWTSSDDDDDDEGREQLFEELRASIARDLTDKQREVVEAYFFEGASQGEIARRLGVAQQVIQKRLFGAARGDKIVGGAIARLRRALSSEPAGEREGR